ncbi:aminopeptidase Q isoform X2 [Ochotona princeps]|uniref:aminopeptidase Q isoform X2 n=1 Tax=Ochotona princeps TaxID=9978 RepID=UPI002714A77E|nr:aminopeptidase Q isoform X2 [Ochotona princeps]
MGSPSSPGFYLSRVVALLLAGLVAALLLALAVLAALFGHCARTPLSESKVLGVPGSASSPPSRQEETRPTPKSGSAQDRAAMTPSSEWRPPGPWDQLRLPSWVVPLHYDLELWPRLQPDALPEPGLRFSGCVNITVRCTAATTRLLLHSLFLDYELAEVLGPLPPGTRGTSVGRVQVNDVWFALDTQYMVLELGEALQPGSRYELRLAFSGPVLVDAREGLFLNVYTDQGKRRALIASQMEPTFARSVFPCFDEPALKATFRITVVHHPAYVALSNMPVLGQSEREDVNGTKWTVTTFHTTPSMPTYVVAVAICDFNSVSQTERGKEVRIWARKEAITDGHADFALNITGPIFSFLEDLFNISYPLPKTDLIALPVFDKHAMENWGLMMFDESLLLLRPSDQLTERKAMITYIVSHEIGHQWFGNLVTMDWWNNLWLSEGFASYLELGVINYLNPKLPRNEIFLANILHIILGEDHALVTRAVSSRVGNFTDTSEINELFDLFTYHKGASLARMLHNFLGERVFITALKSYLEAFSYSNAEQDDLWRHFQMAIEDQSTIVLPMTVKSIMDSWTHRSGFPVVTLNVSTGVVRQEPFYLGKVQTLVTHNDTWIIPILWIKNGTTQSLVWLDKSSKAFPEMQVTDSDHDWVILNSNMTGYYRVNYDNLGWKKLQQQLETDPKAIPVVHRLQLIDDAFSLSKNNYIGIETALDLTKYLAEEDEIIVWRAVLENLVTSDLVSDASNYDMYPLLKKYLLKRIKSIWTIYSTIIRENVVVLQDDYLALISLEKLFGTACWLGLEDCLGLSRELFRKWMTHPQDEYLEYAITTSPLVFNETNVIETVAASEVGRYVAKDFLINHWQAVSERYGAPSLIALMYTIGRTVSTDAQITELQQFFSDMLEEPQRLTVHAKLQTIKNENLENRQRSARIAAWLQKHT